jgi:hypothetical protein
MFTKVKTSKRFKDSHGDEYEPVATLVNNHTTCQVAIVDDCYVAFLHDDAFEGFIPTAYLFPELHEILISLPPLTQRG